jgi:hypothetical protein
MIAKLHSPFAFLVGERKGRVIAYVGTDLARVEFTDGGLEDVAIASVKSASLFVMGQQAG